MKLSPNFSLKEMTAHKRLFVKVLIITLARHMNALKALCENVLQKVRTIMVK